MKMSKTDAAKWKLITAAIRQRKAQHIDVQFLIAKTEKQLGIKLPKFIVDEIMA